MLGCDAIILGYSCLHSSKNYIKKKSKAKMSSYDDYVSATTGKT